MTANAIDGMFDVVGSHAALTYFSGIDAARLGHGYIFTGPTGVGKKTFARRLAQSLHCETPRRTLLGYCGSCAACTIFVAGTHPDFLFYEGRIVIGKDPGNVLDEDDELKARGLVRALSLHGYRSNYRVVVLADISFATHESANALLKIFEEPPAGVVVILTTDSPGTLLPTIRSRFIELAFGPLPTADVARVLVASGFDVEKARVAAEFSLGSIVRGRAILDGDDTGLREASFAWFERAVRGETPDASFLHLDDRELSGAEKRANARELVELSRAAARDWTALQLAGDTAPLLAADQRERLSRLPAREPRALVAVLAAVGETARLADTNVSAGLVVDALRLALAPAS